MLQLFKPGLICVHVILPFALVCSDVQKCWDSPFAGGSHSACPAVAH